MKIIRFVFLIALLIGWQLPAYSQLSSIEVLKGKEGVLINHQDAYKGNERLPDVEFRIGSSATGNTDVQEHLSGTGTVSFQRTRDPASAPGHRRYGLWRNGKPYMLEIETTGNSVLLILHGDYTNYRGYQKRWVWKKIN